MPTDVFHSHAAPAIMLYRPYPPSTMPQVVSHAGGLPHLPDGVSWPHGSDGVALHFLACIDCAELPANDQLPGTGVLFFFARIDEEMCWDDEDDPHDASRVIYAAAPGATATPAPKTLPKIQGGWSNTERDFQLTGEADFTVYARWPLISHPITSWPDMDVPGVGFVEAYDLIDAARINDVAKAAGLPVPTKPTKPIWDEDYRNLTLPADTDTPFPQMWIMADRIARYLINQLKRSVDQEQTSAAAQDWINRAKIAGLGSAVPPNEAHAFQDWLHAIREAGVYQTVQAITHGMPAALQYAAQSPETAARFPAEYYDELCSSHQPIEFDSGAGRVEKRYHQMLGHPVSEQQPPPIERDYVLLLQLFSDYGVDFMFCDVGVAEFWINADDLAAGRFDAAWATTEGG